jgi:DNA polymerase-3 subunit epsilon
MRQHGLSRNGELIILQRFHGGVRSEPALPGEPRRRLLFVDVETTGLSPERDRIIELAAVLVEVALERGTLTAHLRTSSWLEDPGQPLPPEIVALTGIRDGDVAGRALPEVEIRSLFAVADLVVAHHARFDRAMCVARFPWLRAPSMPPWACSVAQVDWRGHGHRHSDLQSLARDHGFFFAAHRATLDVEALIKLLGMRSDTPDAPTYLAELLADAQRPYVGVAAAQTPPEASEELRERGYRWSRRAGHWQRALPAARAEAEIAWLRQLCSRMGAGCARTAEIPQRFRFDDTYDPRWSAG